MKLSTTLSVLLAAALACTAVDAKSPAEYEKEFAAWMQKHHLTFADALEYAKRLENYISNDLFILAHNAEKDSSFTLGHNAFSHMTFDEFANTKKGFAMPQGYLESRVSGGQRNETSPHRRPVVVDAELPDSIDWVAKGGVTGVKNQGQCGSCWAFSTTGAVEGAAFVATGKLVSLSEQELVDCDHNGDQGCHGGLMDHAFDWIEKHGGICAESEYAYHGAEEQCHACQQVVKVTGFTDVDPNDEQALKAAVAQQPVSVAIEADQREFQFYKSGVFDQTCGTQLDHGVLVVGYGEENGKKYWKVKNSWGSTWGEDGYILLAREMGVAAGQCGVAMVPSYPSAVLATANEALAGPDFDVEVEQLQIQDLENYLLGLDPEPVPSQLEQDVEIYGDNHAVYEYFPEGN